jgi:fatty acid desaturase
MTTSQKIESRVRLTTALVIVGFVAGAALLTVCGIKLTPVILCGSLAVYAVRALLTR